jgi:hypothetical protein
LRFSFIVTSWVGEKNPPKCCPTQFFPKLRHIFTVEKMIQNCALLLYLKSCSELRNNLFTHRRVAEFSLAKLEIQCAYSINWSIEQHTRERLAFSLASIAITHVCSVTPAQSKIFYMA